MMNDKELRYTLIADGSSDKTLLKIIKWTLDDLFPKLPNKGTFADFRQIKEPPRKLKEKIQLTLKYYPFDVLFIHRDAESTDIDMIEQRINEIKNDIIEELFNKTICVIPVKMMETWLLINEEAIKKASGNRKYDGEILLPKIKDLEKQQQPKVMLHNLLKVTSGLKGRNLNRININKAVHLVADYIEDFSQLRKLEAFKIFENDMKVKIEYFLNNNY